MDKCIVFNGDGLTRSNFMTGIQRNTIELLKCIDGLIENQQVILAANGDIDTLPEFKNIEVAQLDCPSTIARNMPWDQHYLPKFVKSINGFLVDSLVGLPVAGCDVPFIYDCIQERYPESCYPGITGHFYKSYDHFRRSHALKVSKKVITDSEFAKKDLCTFYKVDPKKIEVIPCAWQHFALIQEDERIIEKLGLEKDNYFFSLGTKYKFKNMKWVIEAAKQNPQYTFVISGRSIFATSDKNAEELPGNVVESGYLTDEEIKALMKHCRAFIHPSFCEGFGIPPMEAMSAGARCVVSNAASLPEVYKKSVWYIDPADYSNIDMDQIMAAEIEPNEAVLNLYSWEKSAQKLWSIITEITA